MTVGYLCILVSLLANLLKASAVHDEGFIQPSVIGGFQVDASVVPWQVGLADRFDEIFCGGTLLNSHWIISAQHCLEFNEGTQVVVGSSLRDFRADPSTQVLPIDLIIHHPNFAHTELGNDVVLIRVGQGGFRIGLAEKAFAVEIDTRRAIPLDSTGIVSGFGANEIGSTRRSDYLRSAAVPIISNELAQAAYNQNGFPDLAIFPSQVAAGNLTAGLVDTCIGDSGGPLVTYINASTTVLTGITSFGKGCAQVNKPGIYTRVAFFDGWVNKITKDLDTGVREILIQESMPSSAEGSWYYREVQIEEGALLLEVRATGFVDVGLYVNYGFPPNPPVCIMLAGEMQCPKVVVPTGSEPRRALVHAYECVSQRPGSTEYCNIAFPRPGMWHVGIFTNMDIEFFGLLKLSVIVIKPSLSATLRISRTLAFPNERRILRALYPVGNTSFSIRFRTNSNSLMKDSKMIVNWNTRAGGTLDKKNLACMQSARKNTCEDDMLVPVFAKVILITIVLPDGFRTVTDPVTTIDLTYVPRKYVEETFSPRKGKWMRKFRVLPGSSFTVFLKSGKVGSIGKVFSLRVRFSDADSPGTADDEQPLTFACEAESIFKRFLKCHLIVPNFVTDAEVIVKKLQSSYVAPAQIQVIYEQLV